MLKNLFQKQQELLNHFFNLLDPAACEIVFNELLNCKGMVFFTGVGKSGFIAQKIAATMLSTGTKALFLSPIDALHGDLGMVSNQDILIILSKSGETEELLQLLPAVRNKGARLIAITSHVHSRLVKGADFAVILPCKSELGPYDLAPTISTEIQLLFGDVLAMALMEAKGISLNEFAGNHPGGSIGKQISIKVKDLMLVEIKTPFCFAHDLLEGVLRDFTDKKCGCLVVIDEQKKLQGIFTDGDLRRALQEKGENVLKQKVGAMMSPSPRSISANAFAWEAMKLMEADQKHPITVLPVIEKERVVGIIKLHDIIQAGIYKESLSSSKERLLK